MNEITIYKILRDGKTIERYRDHQQAESALMQYVNSDTEQKYTWALITAKVLGGLRG